MVPLARRSRNELGTWTGLPSEMTSAAPEAAESVPSVTMKSVMRPLATSRPLASPTKPEARTASTQAAAMFQPWAEAHPSITAPSVIVEATDRSMPAVAMTKVWPTARTTRIAAATSIASKLLTVRKVGVAMKKTMTRTTRPTTAAQSAQKPTSRSRAVSGSVSRTPTAVFVSDMIHLCSRRRGRATSHPRRVRLSAGECLEGVVEGAERLREVADGLVGDVLGHQQHWGFDVRG